MKKKSSDRLALALALSLALAWGCGSNKNLEPQSDLILNRADPPSQNIGVDPPTTHVAYFLFSVKISDSSLSMVPSDAWTIDSYDMNYVLLADPGHHLTGLPSPEHKNFHVQVKPYQVNRVPVTVITEEYLRTDATGLLGTSDTATIKAQLVFQAHRNKDGVRKTLTDRYILTLGNF